MERKKVKIAVASNASWYLWNFRRGLMHELEKDNFSIKTLSSCDEYTERLKKEFSHIENKFLDRGGMNPITDLLLFFEYLFIYIKQKPDLVLNFTIKPNIYSSMACWILGIPAISTVTGLGYVFEKKGLIQKISLFLYKVSIRHNKKVVFQNNEHKKIFLEKKLVTEQQAVLIEGSGVDTEKFCPTFCTKTPENFTFLMVARLLRDKGIYEFIEAARRVKEKYSETKFMVVGGIDVKNPSSITEDVLQSWKQENIIEFVGSVDDVRPYICRSNVVVLPSYHEGLSKSLLEAMAMERPIITTDIPGCRPLVDGNGYLIEPKNIQLLYDAMEKIINLSHEERVQMGHQGRKLVLQKFDQRVIVEAYKRLLDLTT